MVGALWVLFFVGAGVLWVVLIYASLNSSVTEDVDGHRSVWKVLLRGDREWEREQAVYSERSESRSEVKVG